MDNQKVLVVEDNSLNMKLVRTLLELGRFQVIEAETAQQGINLAKERRKFLDELKELLAAKKRLMQP